MVLIGPTSTLLIGAFLFASANCLASALYSRGVSETMLFIIRGVVVYAMNVAQEATRSGRAAAWRVAALSVGSKRLVALCWLRSSLGFVAITLLNFSFQNMNLADAFATVLGVMTILTIALAQLCLDGTERLSWHALCGGCIGIAGIILVTQPEAIFGGATPPSLTGVLTAIGSGCLFSGFNLLSRILGKVNGDGTARVAVSPSMLLSFYMVTVEAGALMIAGLSMLGGWALPWTRLAFPFGLIVCVLAALYCACILTGQLCLASAYGRLPAGKAAIVGLSEIGFSWALDVFILQEPTNALACAGTATVFFGCALASGGQLSAPSPRVTELSKAPAPMLSTSHLSPAEQQLRDRAEQQEQRLTVAGGTGDVDIADWVEGSALEASDTKSAAQGRRDERTSVAS